MGFVFLIALFAVSAACPQRESEDYYRNGNAEKQTTNYSNNSCITPKDVIEFSKHFADEVKSCEKLTNVFNVANEISREEIKAALFFVVSSFTEKEGYKKPIIEALLSMKGTVTNCEKISPGMLRSIYSNSAGKLLLNAKKLSTCSTQLQAKTLASDIKEVADFIVGEGCPRSKMESIIVGFGMFLKSQGLFSANNYKDVSLVFSREWRCQDKNAKMNKKCSIASYSPEKLALKKCDNICKIKNKAIDKFVITFSQKVKNCEVLSNLFNVEPSVSPAVYSRGSYYLALQNNYEYKAENPRGLADFHSRFIRDVRSLKPRIVERVHSQFLGKYLLSEKVLNCKNAEKLAQILADITKAKAEIIVDKKIKASNIVAIEASWRKFLKSLDLISADKAAKLSYLYGNEWRCQA